MKRMMTGLFGAAALAAVGICDLCVPGAAAAVPAEVAAVAADMSTVRLHVEGMTCGGCAMAVRVLLERMEGVDDAEVDYESGIAVVTYDAARVSPAQMIDALTEAFDYDVTVVEDAPAPAS